jgi:hypothetical protein
MVEQRWPRLQDELARADDVLDETSTRVRPTPEERKRIRAEAQAYLAARRAAHKRPTAPEPASTR